MKVIDGYIKKSLDLGSVEIDGHDAIGSGALKQVGKKFCGYGDAAGVFAILPGVSEIRNHGGDGFGAGALEHVDPDEEFAVVRIYRVRSWLNDIAIAAADVFIDADDQFAIGE